MRTGNEKRTGARFGKTKAGTVFGLCPVAHVLLFSSLPVIAAFLLLRDNRDLMTYLSEKCIRPYYSAVSRVFSFTTYSAAEFIVAAFACAVLIYIILTVVLLLFKKNRLARLYKSVITLAATAACVYALFCLLWGVNYYSRGFPETAGISAKPVGVGELESVARYFAAVANEYAPLVTRDQDGRFIEDEEMIFEKSATLYAAVSREYPFLEGPFLRAKPMTFSYFMSYINFTGVFFPFTAEANVNTDSPRCLLPATIAHELAHQRGVAAEEEANFTAVLSCLESGEPVYCYSAALFAFIHLGNALYPVDREAWADICAATDSRVRADLEENSEYWARFDTKAAKVTEAFYDEFLKSYGRELGMQSYGACVDLLVAYYAGDAEAYSG